MESFQVLLRHLPQDPLKMDPGLIEHLEVVQSFIIENIKREIDEAFDFEDTKVGHVIFTRAMSLFPGHKHGDFLDAKMDTRTVVEGNEGSKKTIMLVKEIMGAAARKTV